MTVLFKTRVRARTMKEYQFFRLSTALDFSPCLQQYCRRGEQFNADSDCELLPVQPIEMGYFCREFLRQLADLFENRGLSLNFFRAI